MIDFLKESTFAVNEVIQKAWHILKGQYFLIASLCFLMFMTLTISSSLSQYFSEESQVIRIFLMLLFIVGYCGLQLTLFGYTLRLINSNNDFTEEFFKVKMYNYLKLILSLAGVAILVSVIIATIVFFVPFEGFDLEFLTPSIISVACAISLIIFRKKLFPLVIVIRDNWPSRTQLLNFLGATICSLVLVILAIVVMVIVFFPIVYTGVKPDVVFDAALSVGVVLAMIVAIRISFFPLFIMDRSFSALKSLRFSLAITRGNFTRLLLLLCFLGIFHFLAYYFSNKGLGYLVIVVNTINSFLVVPLSSLVTAVVYRQMISEYRGAEDPDVIHNLL
jgi:hypothetical protein